MVENLSITSKDKVSLRKLERTVGFLKELLSEQDKKVLSGFNQSMTIDGLTPRRKSTILDGILRLTRILDGKEWSNLDNDGINSLVAELMNKYSRNGQETNTISILTSRDSFDCSCSCGNPDSCKTVIESTGHDSNFLDILNYLPVNNFQV